MAEDSFEMTFQVMQQTLKLAVELDGSIHDEPDQKEYDERRQDHLEKFGVTFVRMTNDEFMSNANMAFIKIEEQIKIIGSNKSLNGNKT